MQARTASTYASDAYRAGRELGDQLTTLQPELVLLFTTTQYGDSPEILEGLRDALDNADCLVAGTTGDGQFGPAGFAPLGASALALNSGGEVAWEVLVQEGLHEDAQGACQRALQQAGNNPAPDLAILFADYQFDGDALDAVLQHVGFPVIGGLGGAHDMGEAYQYAQDRVLDNALVMVTARGSLHLATEVQNRMTPVGRPGRIDRAEGNRIVSVDGVPALAFLEREVGKPPAWSDWGSIVLAIRDPEADTPARMRSVAFQLSDAENGVALLASIQEGLEVQACMTSASELMHENEAHVERLAGSLPEPCAAMMVACVGRRGVLGDQINEEYRALKARFGEELPVAGFLAFGEVGPQPVTPGKLRNNLHNMSSVTLLLGV